jgi:hypothetical protein
MADPRGLQGIVGLLQSHVGIGAQPPTMQTSRPPADIAKIDNLCYFTVRKTTNFVSAGSKERNHDLNSRLILTTAAAFGLMVGNLITSPTALASTGNNLVGKILASGTVLSSANAVVPHATVILYAWPSQRVNANIKINQQVPMKVVGTTVTAASGSFSVKIHSLAALTSSVSPGGDINLMIAVISPSGAGTFTFPRQIVTMPDGTALVPLFSKVISASVVAERITMKLMPATASSSMPRTPRICIPVTILKKNTGQR